MKKIYLLFLMALSLFGAKAQVILSENFSTATGTTPPAGWTNTAVGTTTDLWFFNNPGGRTITGGTPGFAAPFAIFDSDFNPTTTGENAYLESPTFNASAAGPYILEFDQQVRHFSGQSCEVAVWNGSVWNVVATYTASLGYPNPATHTSIDISTQVGTSTAAKVRFRFSGIDTWWWAIDNVTVTKVVCNAPTGLAVASVSETGATISWTGTGSYILEYGAPGFTPGTGATAGTGGTVINPATSAQAIGGLSAATAYQVYVRQNCTGTGNGYSSNAGLTFTTPCTPDPIPYNMPIEVVTAPALPLCVTQENVNNDANAWRTYSGISGITGYTYPVIGYQYNLTNNANDWLYTRGLTLTGGTSYTLTFKYGNDQSISTDPGYYPEKLKVLYGTSPTVAAMTLPLADYPTVASATPLAASIQFTPASTGTYYIGFQAYSDANNDFLLLDDISVIPTPSCIQPVGVTAGSVTATSASISFTPGTSGSYIVEYGAVGFTPGTGATAGTGGTVVTGTASPIAIAGLTAATTYDVYVRKNCTGTGAGFSTNSAVASFTTTLDCTATVAFDCGVTQTAAIPAGTGGYGTSDCGFSVPGKELLYSFTAPAAGEYLLEVTAVNSSGYIDYLFKDAADGDCGPTGWTCIADVNTTGELGTFTLTAGQTILLLLDAESSTGAPSQDFRLVCPVPAPANDDAPGAITLTVGAGCTAAPYTNEGATQGATEPYPSCINTLASSSHTVWYKFVATASAVKISTDYVDGTLDDSEIGLFSVGDPFNYATFNIISCDDDNGIVAGKSNSILYATGLTVGQTYYIVIEGYNGATGTFCLTVDNLTSTMLATTASCAASQTPTGIQTGYTGQAGLVDVNGNLIAIVRNPAGGIVNGYNASLNINTGAVRQDGNGHYYLDRSYLINNTQAATNVVVQFFFTNAELAALTAADPTITLSNLGAFKQTGAACNPDFLDANGTGTALGQSAFNSQNGVNWIQVTTPSFSNFYLNKNLTVLPISIEYFRGAKQATANLLDWKVNSTSGAVTMVLERSADGRTYTGIHTEMSDALRLLQPFNYTDAQPLQGVNYYRLKVTEASGKVTYSPIVTLLGKGKGFELIAVQPNPVLNEAMLNITSAAAAKMEIRVTDIVGKTISTQYVSVIGGTNKIPMNFSKLAAGTYQVTGKTSDGEIKTIRFVKQ
ncbi:T9SS type A sorting domain-containing protein [Ferruginibacter sp. HRS2-29]|uniref:T9SS type A sorting domain-containing protein n=1 Tax=Ferruginibacter sp. HRS2-29 TaxID=2487334 RepID=UPI0020CDC909|nr:T9SS type A sorting domain-containing protein [Ferruginibacter sp. HRS2-29]MCP9749473.1 T9SS C-terminal target domain-containing protein [Ferruginibacter sp. HRS2-29]